MSGSGPATGRAGQERRTGSQQLPDYKYINVVDDLGCNPSGSQPCQDKFRAAADDEVILEVPPGDYLFEEALFLEDVTNFGIRGLGSSRRDSTIVHPDTFDNYAVYVESGQNCVFENFALDQTNDAVTNSGLFAINEDGLEIRNVEVKGFTPTENGSHDLVTAVTSEDGEGLVEQFVTKGGAEVGVYPDAWPGLWVGKPHVGDLELRNCHFEECGSNGIYCSRNEGNVRVVGGVYKNSGVSQIRLAGDGSVLEDARIVVDTDTATNVRGSYDVVRGVWWESIPSPRSGGTIRNCDLINRSAPLHRGLLEMHGSAGGLTVENCWFHTDTEKFRAIEALGPRSDSENGTPPYPWGIKLHDLTVTGVASKNAAIILRERPVSELHDVTVHQTGDGRDGIVVWNSSGTRVSDTMSYVSRHPLVVKSDESERINRRALDLSRQMARFPLSSAHQEIAESACVLSLWQGVSLQGGHSDEPRDETTANVPPVPRPVCLADFDVGNSPVVIERQPTGNFHAWNLGDLPTDYGRIP